MNKECQPKFDIEKKVDKTSAKPGDTLKYTLTFKNTGEIDLTNAVIKDVLPKGVTLSGDVKAEPADGVSGDLFSAEGLTIAKVEKGKTVVITFNVKVAAATEFICGTTTLKNVVTSTSKELVEEPNTGNNSATTTVEKDCPPEKDRCEIPGKEHLDKDDPNCKVTVTPPPVNPPTDGGSTSTTTKGGYVPSEIVATGPVETIAGLIAAGALTFGGAAYIRSRQAVRKNLLNR